MRLHFRTTRLRVSMSFFAALLWGTLAWGQATAPPPQGSQPPDDTPSIKLGVMLFTDYTFTAAPAVKDTDGNTVQSSAFNVGRAYINVTGNISHLVAFRITPDISRETGSGSSLNGSYTYRLKYGYGQLNLDDWLGTGSWVRLGIQQTPYIVFMEDIYPYRFQGTMFVDREGFLTSADTGLSWHYNLPSSHGDLHLGIYNGEGYAKPEANNQKAIQLRFSLRPTPSVNVLKGFRVTGFYDDDHYARSDRKTRLIANATFEHAWINAGFEYLKTKDRPLATAPETHANGWSVWVTPRTPVGIAGVFRYDSLNPNSNVPGPSENAEKKRGIAGVAYWFPVKKGVSSAVLADYERVHYDSGVAKPNEKRYALHALFSY